MSNPEAMDLALNSDPFGAGPASFVGKRVGPYTICLELASGGMASVFLARAGSSADRPRLIALKIIHRHLTERRDFVEMFLDEAHISSQLRHPNVCEVYGFDKVDDTYYLAMEYLLGEPLSAVLRRTARRVVDLGQHGALIARVGADACAGLHAAHELRDAKGKKLNVVHRDVSPENLFVTYAGVTKVVDFGLACARHQTHRTRTGVIKGKFAYVCPEALDGARVDHRADIWGMGVVLWEALTGRRLFRGDSDMQTLAAVVDAPIQPPSTVRRGLPPALDRVVLRALSRDPERRQRSAEELGQQLIECCPGAARMSDALVADWMSNMFGSERRWKTQVVELVQALSRPEHALSDADFDSAPTRMLSAPPVARSSPPPPPKRRPLLAAALGLGLLACGALLVRLGPPVERADARELPAPAVTATAAPPPAEKTKHAAPELRAEKLADGSGYLLEIVDSAPGKKELLLRIEPPGTKRTKSRARAPGPLSSPPPRQPLDDSSAPPAWLRGVMERQFYDDFVERWPASSSQQAKQLPVNAQK